MADASICKHAFYKQNGVGYHKFNYWVKKFGKENFTAAAPAGGFSQIPVDVPDLTKQNKYGLAAITFPSGARIELFGSLEASFIRKLVL